MTATRAHPTARGRIRLEPGAKRVRAFLGGEVVADTARAMPVWEVPYHPTYHLPLDDVRADLRPDGGTVHSPSHGDGRIFAVRARGHEAPGAALRYEDSPTRGVARPRPPVDWHAMDAWFEEDEE